MTPENPARLKHEELSRGEIEALLTRAAREAATVQEADAAVIERISAAILPGLQPARPLPPAWVLVTGLVLAGFTVAVAGASILGMPGIRRLTGGERAVIFASVASWSCLAAAVTTAELVPGSRRFLNPLVLAPISSAVLLAIFAVLFSGYSIEGFVRQGIPCLEAGLADAVPAAAATWILLRRGFAVNSVSAGAAAGTLAGLAGLTMLELHCPNLRAIHVMVWHVAVIPVSAFAAALATGLLHSWGLKRRAAELMQ